MAERVVKPEPDIQRMALIAKALADPSRIEILRLLAKDGGCCDACAKPAGDGAGICICDLVKQTRLIQSLVSYHMKVLREAGLVEEEPRGKWKYYRINPQTVQAFLENWSALLLH